MHSNLNIPLATNPTRQRNWRVIWILLYIFSCTLLLQVFFSTILSLEQVSSFKPTNTEQTALYTIKASNYEAITHHIGTQASFQHFPYSINYFIQYSNNHFAIHESKGEIVGISVDKKLSAQTASQLEASGLYVQTHGKNTLISLSEAFTSPKPHVTPSLFFQSEDGHLITGGENQKFPFRIHENQLIIKNKELITNNHPIFTTPSLGESTFVRIPLEITENTSPLINEVKGLFIQGILEMRLEEGQIQTEIYGTSAQNAEKIANISKILTPYTNLATERSFLEDGTAVTEIKYLEDPESTSTYINESNFSIGNPSRFYIQQSEDSQLTISIFTPLQTVPQNTYSVCKSSLGFIDLLLFKEVFQLPFTQEQITSPLFGDVQAIGIDQNTIRYCW